MMAKMLKKTLAMVIALTMLLSLPLTAVAETVETTTDNGDGTSTTVTITTSSGETVGEQGELIKTESTLTESETFVNAEGAAGTGIPEGTVLGSHWEEKGKETTTYEQTENVPDVDVDLIVDGETVEEPAGSAPITAEPPVSADPKESEDDKRYDETRVSTTDREVTAQVGEITVEGGSGIGDEYESSNQTNLEAVNPDWEGTEEDATAPNQRYIYFLEVDENGNPRLDEDGDPIVTSVKYADMTKEQMDKLTEQKPDGYDYLYIGNGEGSEVGAEWKFEGDRGWYYGVSDMHQFQLTDPEIKDLVTAYCTDLDTTSKPGFWYSVKNLEDAGYYQDEEAEDHIRAIVVNGYWGTTGTDENGNVIVDADGNYVTGSLEAMKAMLKAAGEEATGLTNDQIDSLTEGQALAATQIAIWQYGNPYKANSMEIRSWSPRSEVVDAVAEYLKKLSMTAEEAGTTEIINEQKFIDDLSITVMEKVEDHANNQDDNHDNDAYNVNIVFSLVVTPAENDDLIVKVIGSDGNVVKTVRIAGEEEENKIYADDDGNYTISNLQLIEGSNTTFNLKLEGTQYLERGVYIYSSEEKDYVTSNGSISEDVTSQTFVGIAEGYKNVDVSMAVDLTFHVKEGTVTTVREWADYGDPGYEPSLTNDPGDDPDEDPDEETIPDEEVPLAAAPETGDPSLILAAMSLLSAGGLVVINRKKDEE